jgi:hypothetical protein
MADEIICKVEATLSGLHKTIELYAALNQHTGLRNHPRLNS